MDEIPDEWVDQALMAGSVREDMRARLAAVAPLIEARAREAALREAARVVQRWMVGPTGAKLAADILSLTPQKEGDAVIAAIKGETP